MFQAGNSKKVALDDSVLIFPGRVAAVLFYLSPDLFLLYPPLLAGTGGPGGITLFYRRQAVFNKLDESLRYLLLIPVLRSVPFRDHDQPPVISQSGSQP
jgi:hypothetical protein